MATSLTNVKLIPKISEDPKESRFSQKYRLFAAQFHRQIPYVREFFL